MAFSIPGLSTLYPILKRDIELNNDKLEYRRSLAEGLYENCLAWSKALVETFERAVDRWAEDGRDAAEREIMALVNDFQKINYYSLRSESPIVNHLLKDERFQPFAEACVEFYGSALDVKRLVYGDIQDRHGNYIASHEAGIQQMVQLLER